MLFLVIEVRKVDYEPPKNLSFAYNMSTEPVGEGQGFESEFLIKVHRFPSEDDTAADISK